MDETHGIPPKRRDEVEARGVASSGVRSRKGQEGEIAPIRKHRDRDSIDCERRAAVAHMPEDEAGITGLDEGIRGRILNVNAERAFEQRHWRQCRCLRRCRG